MFAVPSCFILRHTLISMITEWIGRGSLSLTGEFASFASRHLSVTDVSPLQALPWLLLLINAFVMVLL